MRKLLLLALLLCKFVTSTISTFDNKKKVDVNFFGNFPDDVVAFANRKYNYDYDDINNNKRHSFDDRRDLRRKALQKQYESDREWEDRRRQGSYNTKYADNIDPRDLAGKDRHGQRDIDLIYKDNRRFDDLNKMKHPTNLRSSELERVDFNKEFQKKTSMLVNCQRQHERYEPCFAGCAAVSCDNPRERLQPCYPFCEPGCVCVAPRVRDDRTHKCVLPEDCTRGLKGIPDIGDEV